MEQPRAITAFLLNSELKFTTSRSGGPGGQNVNKVNTKVTVKFDIAHSQILTDEEKRVLSTKLASKLTNDGVLILTSQDKRTQLQNKEAVLIKLDNMIGKALQKRKKRKPTKPSKVARQKRMDSKKKASEKKKWRQKPT